MKRHRINAAAVVIIVAVAAISGCSTPSSGASTQTIAWQSDGNGFIEYKTNDTAELGYGEYCSYTSTQQDNALTTTAIVKKMTGSAYYGYGILFGYQDSSDFYRLLIAENGYYRVDEKIGGTYSQIVDWTESSYIYTGFGVENTIGITQPIPGTNFSVVINNTTVTTITDSSFSNGESGFYVSIGTADYEDFPSVSEDVRFKMTAPGAIPSASVTSGNVAKSAVLAGANMHAAREELTAASHL